MRFRIAVSLYRPGRPALFADQCCFREQFCASGVIRPNGPDADIAGSKPFLIRPNFLERRFLGVSD